MDRSANVVVVLGAGSIGLAIARRVSAGKHVILGDLHQGNAEAAAITLRDAGFKVSTAAVDISCHASVQALIKAASSLGAVSGLIHAAGVSPSPAGRAGTPDEVANVAALLIGQDGAFITGSDFLMDGGVTASYWFGDLSPK